VVGGQLAVDDVGEPAFQSSDRLFLGLALFEFSFVEDPAWGVWLAELTMAITCSAWLSIRLPLGLSRCRFFPPEETSMERYRCMPHSGVWLETG